MASIQKTATTVDVKIGTEVLRSFTLEEIKPESFTIYYSFNETLFVKKGVIKINAERYWQKAVAIPAPAIPR